MTRQIKSFWMFLICILLFFVPCMANAQESEVAAINGDTANTDIEQPDIQDTDSEKEIKFYTAKDNFGGWKFGADILFGKGRCDDKLCIGHSDEYNHAETSFAIKGQFQISYLWGKNVFFGPVLTGFAGYPSFVGGDIRLKLVIPIGKHHKDAVSASAGWGAQWRFNIIPETYWDYQYMDRKHLHEGYANDLIEYGYNYIPIEMTYEHVFDNRFILGVSAQLNITLSCRYYPYNISYII